MYTYTHTSTYIHTHTYTHILIPLDVLSLEGCIKPHKDTPGNNSCLPSTKGEISFRVFEYSTLCKHYDR